MKYKLNYVTLLSNWNFKKLRNKAYKKRRKELVCWHEASHAIAIEELSKLKSVEIHLEKNNEWCGSATADAELETISILDQSVLGISGLWGELCYLMICQRQQKNIEIVKEDLPKMAEYFIENKFGNYSTDIEYFLKHNDIKETIEKFANLFNDEKYPKMMYISHFLFNNHFYTPNDYDEKITMLDLIDTMKI